MLMPLRALANRLGQMGSTSTLAALRMVVIFFGGDGDIIVGKDECRVGASELVGSHDCCYV